jgi:hypothetical protein
MATTPLPVAQRRDHRPIIAPASSLDCRTRQPGRMMSGVADMPASTEQGPMFAWCRTFETAPETIATKVNR